MPVLKKDFRNTKSITIPGYPDSEVVIYDSVLVSESDIFGELQQNPDKPSNVLRALPKIIKAWNFTDESGKDLPVNPESLNMLRDSDLEFIINEFHKFAEEVKKNKGNMR